MNATLVLPAVAVVAVGLSAGLVQRRLAPSLAVRVLTVLGAVALVAVVGALVLVAFGFVVQIPWVAARAGWCRTLYGSHRVPPWQGVASIATLLLMARGGRAAWRTRRAVVAAHEPSSQPLDVIDTDEPIAYAVPGNKGAVVVSTGMLRALEPPERRVLLAHEQSHLRHGHHRYLAVADIAAAALPVLRPLRAQVRFSIERWADEDAAAEVGDRRLTARAITRAALAQADWQPQLSLALASLGVPGRVEALLADAPASPLVAEAAATAGGAALMVSVGSSALQLHHLLAFAAHICRV